MDWNSPLVTALAAALAGLFVWFIQSRIEAARQAESRLRDERRKTYADLLTPFFKAMSTPTESWKKEKALDPFNMRRAAFEVSIIGSDDVIRAFNKMMQALYRVERENKEIELPTMLQLWGELLLEVRKSVGDPRTKLRPRDMLAGLMKDIDQLLARQK
jgi:hypothetical protein